MSPRQGWIYGGGSYTFANQTIKFVVNLEPGDWHIAASFMPDEEGAEEVMELYPLTVTAPAAGSPMPVDGPTAGVIMTLEDVAFGGWTSRSAAGSTLFEVRNTGEQHGRWCSSAPTALSRRRTSRPGLLKVKPVLQQPFLHSNLGWAMRP
jgi:hypothetical protein